MPDYPARHQSVSVLSSPALIVVHHESRFPDSHYLPRSNPRSKIRSDSNNRIKKNWGSTVPL
jgi:hypothetical protein